MIWLKSKKRSQRYDLRYLSVLVVGIGACGLLLQIVSLVTKYGITRPPSIWDSDGNLKQYLIPSEEFNDSDIEYLSYNTSFSYPTDLADFHMIIRNSIRNDKVINLKVLNEHKFTYIHLPRQCSFKDNDSLKLGVLIKSNILNFGLRTAQRTLLKRLNDSSVQYAFMLGYSNLPGMQPRIDDEAKTHQDIIQEEFTDAYFNNTYKTVMAYNWAVRYCATANLLFFQDDDFHVKWTDLLSILRIQCKTGCTDIYNGSTAVNAPPYRERDSKWFLSFQDYPFDIFPPYAGGGAYIVSFDVALRLQRAFPYVKYLGIDDVYLGIVALKLNIQLKNDSKFNTINTEAIAVECSHVVENLIAGQCDLAIKKRQIYMLRYATAAVLLDNGISDFEEHVDDTVYLSYDAEFAYPLKVQLDLAVNLGIKSNNKIPYKPIHTHPFKSINTPKQCSYPVNKVYPNILVLVKSNCKNILIRQEVRAMWNSVKVPTIKVIFLLGRKMKNQTLINEEYTQHGDILQENFEENHMHSTRKLVMGFNWVEEKCSTAKLILVMDDFYYGNISKIISYLRRIPSNADVFKGKLFNNHPPHRERKSKWRLSYDQYPFDKFPPYLSGGAFLISYNMLRKFKLAFPYVQYLGIDDVYLGIVAKKLRVIPIHDSFFEPLSTVALLKRCPRDVNRLVAGKCIDRNVKISEGSCIVCNNLMYGFSFTSLYILNLYFT